MAASRNQGAPSMLQKTAVLAIGDPQRGTLELEVLNM